MHVDQRLRAKSTMSQRKTVSNIEAEGRLTKVLRSIRSRTGTPGPSEACPTPPSTLSKASPAPPPSELSEDTPRPSAEPSSDSQRPLDTYDAFINGTDPSPNLPYNGLKALLAVIDKVGYALPPLRALAAGLGSVLTVIDVCTAASPWVTMRELMDLMRQKTIKNKADYDVIRLTLGAILSMAQEHQHRQDETQRRALDRRVEKLAKCVVL